MCQTCDNDGRSAKKLRKQLTETKKNLVLASSRNFDLATGREFAFEYLTRCGGLKGWMDLFVQQQLELLQKHTGSPKTVEHLTRMMKWFLEVEKHEASKPDAEVMTDEDIQQEIRSLLKQATGLSVYDGDNDQQESPQTDVESA